MMNYFRFFVMNNSKSLISEIIVMMSLWIFLWKHVNSLSFMVIVEHFDDIRLIHK